MTFWDFIHLHPTQAWILIGVGGFWALLVASMTMTPRLSPTIKVKKED